MKKREPFVDDGRTIADMSADWMPWNRGFFRGRANRKKTEGRQPAKMSKQEERETYRAAVWAMYRAMLPQILCIVAAFVLVSILLKMWFT